MKFFKIIKFIFLSLLVLFPAIILPSFASYDQTVNVKNEGLKNKKISYKEIRKRKHSKNNQNIKAQVVNCTGVDTGCPSGQICSQQGACCVPCPYNSNICDDSVVPASLTLDLSASNLDGVGNSADSSDTSAIWIDRSGNVNNGTLINFTLPTGGSASGWDGAGGIPSNPSVLKLDGMDDYVEISNKDLASSNITICAWVKKNDATDTLDVIVSGETSMAVATFFIGQWNLYGGNLAFGIWTGSSFVSAVSGQTISDTNWHYVVGLGNSLKSEIWLDGQLKGTGAGLPSYPIGSKTNIGRSGYSGNRAYFNGSIANVRIYNTALTAYQVCQSYSTEAQNFPNTTAVTCNRTGLCNASLISLPPLPLPFTPAVIATPTPSPTSTVTSTAAAISAPSPTATPAPSVINSGSTTSQGTNVSPPSINSQPSNPNPQAQPTPLTQTQVEIINTTVKNAGVIDFSQIQKNINAATSKPKPSNNVKPDSAKPYIDFSQKK